MSVAGRTNVNKKIDKAQRPWASKRRKSKETTINHILSWLVCSIWFFLFFALRGRCVLRVLRLCCFFFLVFVFDKVVLVFIRRFALRCYCLCLYGAKRRRRKFNGAMCSNSLDAQGALGWRLPKAIPATIFACFVARRRSPTMVSLLKRHVLF